MPRVTRVDRNETRNLDTGELHVEEIEVDVTRDAVLFDLHAALRAETSRPVGPTLAELTARVDALTRLVIGADLLDDPGPIRNR